MKRIEYIKILSENTKKRNLDNNPCKYRKDLWKENEVKFLKENYSKLSFKLLEEKLNRDKKRIMNKATLLDLHRNLERCNLCGCIKGIDKKHKCKEKPDRIEIINFIKVNKDKLSNKEIGEMFNVSKNVIAILCSKNNIKKDKSKIRKRLMDEGKIKSWSKDKICEQLSGEKNPNWKGGIAFEPYDKNFNKQFKKSIRDRDGCCLLCSISIEDLNLLKREIHIHHINYNKELTINENCCCLCNSCHSKTTSNRSHWAKFFQSILSERYGYKYTENGDIVMEVNNA